MAKTMNIDTSRIVKLLAAQFDFDANDGLRIVAASTARTARTDRTDFLEDLAIAESKDEAALAKAKMSPADKKEAAAAKKAEREAKKAAKEAKPKRAPTGYLMFCKELRPYVKAELVKLLVEGEKLAPTDTVRELAAQWNGLSDQERAEWKNKAADNKEAMKSGTSSEAASSSDEASDETVVSTPAPAPPAPVVPPPPTEPAPEPPATARKSRAKKASKEKKLKTVDETKDDDSSD
jgi:hypothetical protein